MAPIAPADARRALTAARRVALCGLLAAGCATHDDTPTAATAEPPDATAPAAPASEAAAMTDAMAMSEGSGDAAMSEHCAKKPDATPFERSTHRYSLPDTTLTDQFGAPFKVRDLEAGDQPVALNFIFATCTTICPVMTATFSQMREALGDDAGRVRLVSMTIDPEADTPAVLAAYAKKFDAPDDWAFLTGPAADVQEVLRAFDVFNGTKFNHKPVYMLHAPGSDEWIRLDGLGSGAALADEVVGLLKVPEQL